MVPASALRETVILIIFGIVLVPIAAKRAQDAPGYWQTFSASRAGRQPPACAVDHLPWSSRLARMVDETLTYAIPAAAALPEGSAKVRAQGGREELSHISVTGDSLLRRDTPLCTA